MTKETYAKMLNQSLLSVLAGLNDELIWDIVIEHKENAFTSPANEDLISNLECLLVRLSTLQL